MIYYLKSALHVETHYGLDTTQLTIGISVVLEVFEAEIITLKNDVKRINRKLMRIDTRLRDIEEALGKIEYTHRIRKCNPFDKKTL